MAASFPPGAGATNLMKTVAFGLLFALLALRVAAAGNSRLVINKCCEVNQQLNSQGNKCVKADRAPYNHARKGLVLVAPFDRKWLSQWLPPGISLQSVEEVWLQVRTQVKQGNLTLPVNRSALFSEKTVGNDTYWRETVVFDGAAIVIRNELRRKMLRTVFYCVDSLNDSKRPFALVVQSTCKENLFSTVKCCKAGKVLKINGRKSTCKHQDIQTSFNMTPGLLLKKAPTCKKPTTLVWDTATHDQIKNTDFCSTTDIETPYWLRRVECADYIVEDNNSRPVLVYCELSCVARGVYSYCRYLPFATMALLVLALVVIACSSRQRVSAHGWALATHASCLLAFNAGQAVFLLVTANNYADYSISIPLDKKDICLSLAFSTYIFMIAAACWFSAVSINMASGFSVLQGRRGVGSGRERRRFLWLCAGAWGLTAALATAAITTFSLTATPQYYTNYDGIRVKKFLKINYIGPWYLPSFAETRTCFSDVQHSQTGKGRFSTNKLGSLLFYFLPVSALLVDNVVCLATTARRVHFLRRGNSLLQRASEWGGGGGRRAITHAQSMLVYMKLLLTAGVIETVMEIAVWANSQSDGNYLRDKYVYMNHMYVYRIVGSFCDLLRALSVLWLAAPGVGPKNMTAIWKRVVERRKETKKK